MNEKNTVAQLFDVSAACARGYEGKGAVTACKKTGQQYTLSGCKYSTTTCVAPKSQVGYLVTEVELRKIVFDVNAQCAPGYVGTGKATRCNAHNGPYTLSGCSPAPVCVSPKDLTGYEVTESSLDRDSFKVSAACAVTHTGNPNVHECTKNLGVYSLSGCAKKIECTSPNFDGYVVKEQNTVAQTFDVSGTCARGYEGKAVATACKKTGQKYTLSGCKYSTTTCAAPKSQVGYLVTEVELRKIVFDVNAQCAPGYVGTGKATRCNAHNGPYTLSGCSPAPVCVSPKDLTGYDVTESSLDRDSFKVSAACAVTHTGNPKVHECTKNLGVYSLSGCAKKIECTSPNFDGYVVTEQNTVAQTFDVSGSCARGYEGKAVATACKKTGQKYTLSGCKYSTTTCAAPKSTTGYLVTEGELRKILFDVTVQCAPGYVGAAKVEKCNGDKQPYTLSGCSPAPVCVSPKSVTGYTVTETSLDRGSFKVSVKCSATHIGEPKVAACTANLGSYSVSGCVPKIECASPDNKGYAVTEKSTVAQSFSVPVACARGYEGKGVATACSKTGEPYTLSGCKYSTTTCSAPKSTKGYVVTEVELRKIVFDATAQCAPGYVGAAKVEKCNGDKQPYILSGCSPAPVCVSPKDLTGYTVTETSLDRGSFKVSAKCSATHIGEPKVAACTANLGSYSISGCVPKIECASPDKKGYAVTEKSTVAQSFSVPVACARGYEGKGVATACSKTGEPYTLSGCKYSTTMCTAPSSSKGYVVTESELRKIVFDVAVQCAPGYVGAAKVAKCNGDKQPYTLSGCSPAPVCVAPKDLTGYTVTETSLDRGSFKVSVKCSATHIGEPKVAACTADMGSYSVSGCVPKIQCTSPSKTGYDVTETSTVAQHFQVPVKCAKGYEGKASVSACTKHGTPYTLAGCKLSPTTCTAPQHTLGYLVTEVALQTTSFDVNAKCAPGYTGVVGC